MGQAVHIKTNFRVLTHSDDTFYQICRPKFDPKDSLKLEEDKMKVSWKPADIERWLHSSGKDGRSRSHRSIVIDSYEVTIFPAESVKNTHTLPATRDDLTLSKGGCYTYDTWFYDLLGGKIEYVVTIACMIGKSRMKGEKVVTTLVPYGPEKPRSGMQKSAGTDQVEIFWDPPKGDFTKYTLYIDKLRPSIKHMTSTEGTLSAGPSFLRLLSNTSSNVSAHEWSNSDIRVPVVLLLKCI